MWRCPAHARIADQLAGLGEDSTSIYAEVDWRWLRRGAPGQNSTSGDRHRQPGSGALVSDWDVKAGELIVTFWSRSRSPPGSW